jgi:hypothetical protein
MDTPRDFHDLFSGGATPVFDSSDPLDSFWAGLDTNDLPQPALQDNRASVEPQTLQQHITEEGEDETEGEAEDEEAGGHDGQPCLLMLHQWDGTAEQNLMSLLTVEVGSPFTATVNSHQLQFLSIRIKVDILIPNKDYT